MCILHHTGDASSFFSPDSKVLQEHARSYNATSPHQGLNQAVLTRPEKDPSPASHQTAEADWLNPGLCRGGHLLFPWAAPIRYPSESATLTDFNK